MRTNISNRSKEWFANTIATYGKFQVCSFDYGGEWDLMKVLMVTPSYHPILGGTETVVRNLSIKLNEMGIHTDVMTFNMNRKWNPAWKGKTEKIDGVNVFKIAALNWLPIGHSQRITFKINLIPGRFTYLLKNYDLIHFHDDSDLTFPLFSYFVKKPKLLHLHGFYFDFYRRNLLSRYMLKMVADAYIPIARTFERDLVELGIPESKIRRLPNGVDVKKFHPSKEKIDNLLLFVGRISTVKGLHILLKSLRYLIKPVHLVIIGPPDYGFEEILRLINKENERGVHEVTYLGILETEDVIKWYQRASIFVHPSLFEVFPVTNLEALSCGTPVVATNVAGIPEIVRDRQHGILVPPNNPARLAEAIQYLLENEDIRIKFGREGRKWVVKNFSLEAVTEKLCRIYKEIV